MLYRRNGKATQCRGRGSDAVPVTQTAQPSWPERVRMETDSGGRIEARRKRRRRRGTTKHRYIFDFCLLTRYQIRERSDGMRCPFKSHQITLHRTAGWQALTVRSVAARCGSDPVLPRCSSNLQNLDPRGNVVQDHMSSYCAVVTHRSVLERSIES